MLTYTLLVKIKHFPTTVKNSSEKLISYVIDYADYSTFVLEQLGVYRYRQMYQCVIGQEDPRRLESILKNRNPKLEFFCNNRTPHISRAIYGDAINRPYHYAIVLLECYQ